MTVNFEHGTVTGYARTCRCIHCKRAHADYMIEYRARVRRWELLGREVERLILEARS